ncbi:MAG: hypothetical protein AAGL49_13695, partial [Pseudomonadota bacterium]
WALFSAMLLTSWFAWDFAAEARPYIFSLLFATAQTLLAARAAQDLAARKRLRPGFFVSAGLLSLAASYTHYFGFLLSGGFFAALLALAVTNRRWRDAQGLFATGVAVAAVTGVWLAISLTALQGQEGGGFWNQKSLVATMAEFFGTAFSVNLPLVGAVAIAAVMAVNALWRDPAARTVAIMGAVCFAAALVLSLATPLIYYRYLIVLAPVLFYLSAWALDRAAKPWLTAVAVVAMLSVSLPLSIARSLEPREEWREAAAYFDARWGEVCEGATVMVLPDYFDNMPQRYSGHKYYLPDADINFVPFAEERLSAAYLNQACPVILWAGHLPTRAFLRLADELALTDAETIAGRFERAHFLVQD